MNLPVVQAAVTLMCYGLVPRSSVREDWRGTTRMRACARLLPFAVKSQTARAPPKRGPL
jgi:hypothetical protein